MEEFVPPILIKILRKAMKKGQVYSSYQGAQIACKNSYDEDRLARIVFKKTNIYKNNLVSNRPILSEIDSLRTLIGLSLALKDNELNVIDFGGACGTHYFIANAFFGESNRLRWHIVETPTMKRAGKNLEDGQLRFFDNVSDAKKELGRVDLIFSSGALQYVPDPYETLNELVECGSTNIFITRVGLSKGDKEITTIQKSRLSANGPGPLPEGEKDDVIRYPVSFVRKDIFERIMSKYYTILILFEEEKDAYFAGKYSIDTYGYFGKRRVNGT